MPSFYRVKAVSCFSCYNSVVKKRKEKVSRLTQKFAMRIKFERIRRGFSQEKLAKFAGIGKSTLSQIEGQLCSPTLDVVEKISRALGYSTAELISDEQMFI